MQMVPIPDFRLVFSELTEPDVQACMANDDIVVVASLYKHAFNSFTRSAFGTLWKRMSVCSCVIAFTGHLCVICAYSVAGNSDASFSNGHVVLCLPC